MEGCRGEDVVNCRLKHAQQPEKLTAFIALFNYSYVLAMHALLLNSAVD